MKYKSDKSILLLPIIGYLFLISIFVLPKDFLSLILGNLRYGGLVSLIIAPSLGVLGTIFTLVKYRFSKPLILILNMILIFAFPLLWALGSLLLGP